MDPMTVIMWVVMGAIGGFLHWIIPTAGDKPDNWMELLKRVIAGAIAVPLVMASGISVMPELENYGYIGQVLLGYFAIDVWKMLRDYRAARARATDLEE